MKKRKKGDGSNTGKAPGRSVQGTGKQQATAPGRTHKKGGAIMSPKKAKGPLDNRGPRGTGHSDRTHRVGPY